MQNNNNLRPNSVKSNSKQTSDWHFSRQVHTEAFKSYVALSKRKKYINLTILIIIINKFLYEPGGLKLEDPFSSAHKLEKNIKDFYGDKIIIHNGKIKNGNIFFSSS